LMSGNVVKGGRQSSRQPSMITNPSLQTAHHADHTLGRLPTSRSRNALSCRESRGRADERIYPKATIGFRASRRPLDRLGRHAMISLWPTRHPALRPGHGWSPLRGMGCGWCGAGRGTMPAASMVARPSIPAQAYAGRPVVKTGTAGRQAMSRPVARVVRRRRRRVGSRPACDDEGVAGRDQSRVVGAAGGRYDGGAVAAQHGKRHQSKHSAPR
jgi:hypothetical protein